MSRVDLIKMFENEDAETFNKCSKAYEKGRKDERERLLYELENTIDYCDDGNDMLMLIDLLNKLKAGITND